MSDFPLVIVGGPWPERIGLRCRDVTAELDQSLYPAKGKGKGEVVVLIPDDPFGFQSGGDGWTCVIGRNDLASAQERT